MRNFGVFWILFEVFLLHFGSKNLVCGAVEPVTYESKTILEPCLLSLCDKYFTVDRKSGGGSLVVVNSVNNERSYLQRRVIASFNEDKQYRFGVMTKDATKFHRVSNAVDKVQNYLVIVNDPGDVSRALELWKKVPTWNPLATAVIFVLNPINTTETKNLIVRKMFSLMLNESMIYVNAMFQMADDPYKMIVESWFPYQGNGCAKIVGEIHTINECVVQHTEAERTRKKISNVNQHLFPKLPFTLHNCELHVSTFIWAPFTIGLKNRDGKIEVKAGVEFEMLQTITKQMKMELVIRILNNTNLTKRVTDNQTDIYADLIQKKADVVVGGLFENPISRKLVSSSVPYYQDDITWCVVKAGLALMWMNIFLIFNISTWIGLLLTFVIASIFLYYFVRSEGNYRENYVWSFLVTFSVGIGQYGHYWSRKGAIRVFMATLFFFGLHINTAYKSYLIKVLTNPRHDKQISTVTEAIEAGLIFHAAESTADFFDMEDAISQYLKHHHKVCNDLDECFKDISTNRTKALAISRTHAYNNPFLMKEKEDFYCFTITNDVVIYSAVMMFQRNHHLLPRINAKIRTLSESGLLEQWQEDSSRIAHAADDAVNQAKGDGKQMKLRLEHVEGAFLFVLIGLGIAFIVFLLELLTQWLLSREKNHRFLKTMESFLCRA